MQRHILKAGRPEHHYVDRESGRLVKEQLFQDEIVGFIYCRVREKTPFLFKALTSRRFTALLGYINYDAPFLNFVTGSERMAAKLNLDLSECLEDPQSLDTPRKIFERKIRYWETRPLPSDPAAIVSPADARILLGSFSRQSILFIKDKFFAFAELIGKKKWQTIFFRGDFAIFRLTPDKYHYNHMPVSGRVVDIFTLDGAFNSCNPDAVISVVTPYSKNRRVVTIIDSDVDGGSQVGRVAMVEVVAMMIGGIRQCYSGKKYDCPQPVVKGLFVEKGKPKSLYRPGSSTDILIFEPDRIKFADDLVGNQKRVACSRFSDGFVQPLLETDVKLRSLIAYPAEPERRKND